MNEKLNAVLALNRKRKAFIGLADLHLNSKTVGQALIQKVMRKILYRILENMLGCLM